MICKVAFKMFLNITPSVENFSQDGKSFSIVLNENPLAEFVELPVTLDPKVQKNYGTRSYTVVSLEAPCK